MLNSRFGLRQAANMVSSSGDHFSSAGLTQSQSNNNSSRSIVTKESSQASSGGNESYVIAKYDYQSQGPQELTIRKGDKLLLLDDSRHWWKVLNLENQTGFVPSNYVKKEKQSLFDSIRRGISVKTKSKKNSPLATTITNQSPSSSPQISRKTQHDIKMFSLAHVQGADAATKPFTSNSNYPRPFEPTKKLQTHSDILIQELGPTFNMTDQRNDACGFAGINNNNNNNTRDLLDPRSDSMAASRLNSSNATVKHNYKAQQPDELSLTKGAKIRVLEKSDDGWWKGELHQEIGWFPSNYVVEQANNNMESNQIGSPLKTSAQYRQQNIDNSANQVNSQQAASNTNTSQPPTGSTVANEALFVVIALYSFQSQNEEELSFTKDERLDIIEKPINDPDWWRAVNQLGEIGLVPKNYVQIVPGLKSIHSQWNDSATKTTQQQAADSRLQGSVAQRQQSATQNNSIDLSESQLSTMTSDSDAMAAGSATLASGAMTILSSGQHPIDRNSLMQLTRDLEIKLNLTDKVWYHGVMSRQQCDQLLNAYADDGDFLIRNSETNAGDFSVSLKAPVRNKHFRVHYVEDSFCIGQRKFTSLDELVEHYKRTPIYTSATGEKIYLKKPYCR